MCDVGLLTTQANTALLGREGLGWVLCPGEVSLHSLQAESWSLINPVEKDPYAMGTAYVRQSNQALPPQKKEVKKYVCQNQDVSNFFQHQLESVYEVWLMLCTSL